MNELKNLLLLSVENNDLTIKLRDKRFQLNAVIAKKANGINQKLLDAEKLLRNEIRELESIVSSSVRNNNLIQIMDSVIGDEDFVKDTLIIKSFYKIIVASPEELVLVISGSKDTEELSKSIEELKTLPSLLSKLYIDYDQQKGIKYRVVYHEIGRAHV